MSESFAIYSRRTNKLEGAKECAVVSTTELNKLHGDLAALTERLMIRDEKIARLKERVAYWRDAALERRTR